MHRNIRHPRKICLSYKNKYFSYYCFSSLIFTVLHTWIFILILLSGDVEVHPGPDFVESSTDTNDSLSSASFNSLANHLSILHLNIQSILPKIDLVRGQATAHDILIFTESWLKPTTNNNAIQIENFLPPYRTDKCDCSGGGVIAYVRDTLSCKRRTYLEVRGVEGLWLEVNIKTKTILVGGFYRPPNSNADYLNLIKESIDRACSTSIIDIIITGDFNYDISKPQNKISELIHKFNLTQLITEPTHYTETSTSTIDLILVRNITNVLCSGVADSFIPEQVRYHCQTIVILKFLRAYIPAYKRRIRNFQLADYEKYKRLLNESNILEKIEIERNIDKTSKIYQMQS